MALIRCPECNKEISDKSEVCIGCGCPVSAKETNKIESIDEDTQNTEEKIVHAKKTKKPLFVIIALVLSVIAITIAVVVFALPYLKYNKAIDALDNGDYEKAYSSLSELKNYKDSKKLCEYAKNETYVFSCIDEIDDSLKNPDSLVIREVFFYKGISEDVDLFIVPNEIVDLANNAEKPFIVIDYTAQNGYGGNNREYALFAFDTDNSEYTYIGSCDSLDEDEVIDEENKAVCRLIGECNKYFHVDRNCKIERINKLFKDNKYSDIGLVD